MFGFVGSATFWWPSAPVVRNQSSLRMPTTLSVRDGPPRLFVPTGHSKHTLRSTASVISLCPCCPLVSPPELSLKDGGNLGEGPQPAHPVPLHIFAPRPHTDGPQAAGGAHLAGKIPFLAVPAADRRAASPPAHGASPRPGGPFGLGGVDEEGEEVELDATPERLEPSGADAS